MKQRTADFRDQAFLLEHIRNTMAFYHPRCIDQQLGGFFQHFRDDGSIYDPQTRHLVSSTRFIFNYAMAAIHADSLELEKAEYLEYTRHGVEFLRRHHLNPKTGGYAWLMNGTEAIDSTNHCYGLAFVLLAYSSALKAGVQEVRPYIAETYQLMEQHFWCDKDGLYRDEISADWTQTSPYRGQNANMHSCEAMIAAYEATEDILYLDRAFTLASHICQRQASQSKGKIWEHYDSQWQIDWQYNLDDPKNLFRPWGFQPGHFTEWSKLLLMLERHRPETWLYPRAKALFDSALENAWDAENGGICYGFSPDGDICDGDKYFWVQAESFAAAALMAERSNDPHYWQWYQRIWNYSWNHMIDHENGAWFRILDQQNNKYDNLKSPAGKTDYHTMGACYEVLRQLKLSAERTR
ncbi:AGE family epimerase/isomerase [Motiliproteus sp. MSK22-1]|uniref:AGE family epimerase/isomerase n=1 Tax=Motiliproteus sp. MSK22-1 TaxID=1897630 RepID=UPI000978CC1E|nr:AGE family epimerase/isomerase [Motiliproteus sp. MSK22-1]OMH25781.1 N-acylglucosamine 2-epimerase [Motiliproteus sp. MSK22-1]